MKKEMNDCICISSGEFGEILEACRKKYGCAWSKEFREMQREKLEIVILEYMRSWMLAGTEDGMVWLFPAVGKFTGVYPQDFLQREEEKHG